MLQFSIACQSLFHGGKRGDLTFTDFFQVWRNGSGCVCTLDKTIAIQHSGSIANSSSVSTATGWKEVTIAIYRRSDTVNLVKGEFENKVTSPTKQWTEGENDGKWYEYLGIQ